MAVLSVRFPAYMLQLQFASWSYRIFVTLVGLPSLWMGLALALGFQLLLLTHHLCHGADCHCSAIPSWPTRVDWFSSPPGPWPAAACCQCHHSSRHTSLLPPLVTRLLPWQLLALYL